MENKNDSVPRERTNKNVKDVVPILARDFIDYQLSIDKIREYQIFFESVKSRLGLLSQYMFNQMQSFVILSVSFHERIIDIKINDTIYWVNKQKDYERINLSNILFPFHMIIKNVNYFTVNKVLENGQIVELANYSLEGTEILFDQLINFEKDHIEIGLTVRNNSEEIVEYVLVLISAKKIDIIESQDIVLNELDRLKTT